MVGGLFRTHGLSLIRLAVLLVGDQATAEDVVQDAFLGFHRARRRLRDQDKALSYLKAKGAAGGGASIRTGIRSPPRPVHFLGC